MADKIEKPTFLEQSSPKFLPSEYVEIKDAVCRYEVNSVCKLLILIHTGIQHDGQLKTKNK